MKKYHVYGLGNALLDREARVDEALLDELSIQKGVMTLTDDATHNRLVNALNPLFCHYSCGGSVANAIIAVSQFGGRGFYSCKVADDKVGQLFLTELVKHGVDCNLTLNTLPAGVTGQCLVMVTSDAQRTMNSHLGITETLGPDVLDFDAIAAAEYLYIEGYLVTSPTAREAVSAAYKHAKNHQTKIALTLSDPNIVHYFKNELQAAIGDGIDLLFCNEEEILLFTQTAELQEAIGKLQPLANTLIVTQGKRGAILSTAEGSWHVPASSAKAIDTVGAGDMFAGAYLYGITHNYTPLKAIALAHQAAGKVVSQFGARLENEEILAVKQQFE